MPNDPSPTPEPTERLWLHFVEPNVCAAWPDEGPTLPVRTAWKNEVQEVGAFMCRRCLSGLGFHAARKGHQILPLEVLTTLARSATHVRLEAFGACRGFILEGG